MRLSLCLIARNESANVNRCLASLWDHVDEVVFVDTGSTDDTLDLARRFALEHDSPGKLVPATFEWCDDFAAARNHADSLASGDWRVWADLDDVVEGAEHLRDICRRTPREAGAVFAFYDYARDPAGNTICELWRERLVRADGARWHGRVHEAQVWQGGVTRVEPSVCRWVHLRDHSKPSRRNLEILKGWAVDSPKDPRVLSYLAVEHAAHGEHAEAVDAYQRYFTVAGQPAEQRAQTARRLCCSLLALGRPDQARTVALQVVGEYPQWPDTYLTLAECSFADEQWEKVIDFATQAAGRGKPETLLIVNPTDYTVAPRLLCAAAHAALHRFDEACRIAEQALQIAPGHPAIADAYRGWLGERQVQHTARTWLACADLLVAKDEQAKALVLLEQTAPHFVTDHPAVVASRSMLRERLRLLTDPAAYRDHYENASQPEDMVADPAITGLCEALPRVQMLRRGLQETAA